MRWARPRFSQGNSPGTGTEARRTQKVADPPPPDAVLGNCRPRTACCRCRLCCFQGSAPSPHTRGEPAARPGRSRGERSPGTEGPLAKGGPPGAGAGFLLVPDPGTGSFTRYRRRDANPGAPPAEMWGGVWRPWAAAPLGRPPRPRALWRARVWREGRPGAIWRSHPGLTAIWRSRQGGRL